MSDIDTIELKGIMKEAFSEALNSNKQLIYDVIMEAFEDYHFLEAIKEGESSGKASREEVFAVLEGRQ